MEVLFGTQIVVSGDRISSRECSLLVMNHRTRLDWNFLWGLMFYAAEPPSHRLKFVLKAPIRHTPGPGKLMSNVLNYFVSFNLTHANVCDIS